MKDTIVIEQTAEVKNTIVIDTMMLLTIETTKNIVQTKRKMSGGINQNLTNLSQFVMRERDQEADHIMLKDKNSTLRC